MRRFLLALALLAAPALSSAQTLSLPYRAASEAPLWGAWPNAALAAAAGLGGAVLPPKTTTVTRVTLYVSGAGGGGAGTTVVTLTDGTNTCTATFPCTQTNALGAYSAAAVNGAGGGCRYAPSSAVTASVTTAGCTTTQPSATSVTFVGTHQ